MSRRWYAREGTAKLCGVREGVRYRMLHSAADQNGDAGVQHLASSFSVE